MDCPIQTHTPLHTPVSNAALQNVLPADLAAARNWRGIWFQCIVATTTLAPAYPAAYDLQPRRGTDHDVSFELNLR